MLFSLTKDANMHLDFCLIVSNTFVFCDIFCLPNAEKRAQENLSVSQVLVVGIMENIFQSIICICC